MKTVSAFLAFLVILVTAAAYDYAREKERKAIESEPTVWIGKVPTIEATTKVLFEGTDNKAVGTLSFDDGVLKFEGNADESARIFFDHFLKPMVDAYIEKECGKKQLQTEAPR